MSLSSPARITRARFLRGIAAGLAGTLIVGNLAVLGIVSMTAPAGAAASVSSQKASSQPVRSLDKASSQCSNNGYGNGNGNSGPSQDSSGVVCDTISFDSQGGSPVDSLSGADSSSITLPGAPNRSGYSFLGWFADSSGGQALTSPYTLTGDLTLFAQWSASGQSCGGGSRVGHDGGDQSSCAVSVTFAANTGTGTMTSESFTSGVEKTLSADSFVKPGYSFAGWNTSADGNGTPYAEGASLTLSSALTLFAQWTPNTNTVTFAANTGTMTSESFTSGVEKTLTTDSFVKPGYSFAGWNTSADGNGTPYAEGASLTLTGDLTLFAQWKVDTAPTMNTSGLPTSFPYGRGGVLPFTWSPGSGVTMMNASISGTGLSATSRSCSDHSAVCSLSVSDGTDISYVGGPGSNLLTISPLTPPGTYTFVISVGNAAGSSSQSYTFTVASANAPSDVVAATDLTRAQAVNLTWNAPAEGVVLSYDIQVYDVSVGAPAYTTITGLTPGQVGCTSASSACALNISPSNYDRSSGLVAGSGLAGGQTFDFVVLAIFNQGTESSATSNFTLPTSVAPSDSTHGNTSLSSSTTSTSTASATVEGQDHQC
ncbi:MAG: InlB B-repeat-containing protein [Acidimicrobiales bacterium]